MGGYIMAIDQGTTGSRVLIVDRSGQILSSAYAEIPQIFPKPGWVEHDPEVLWDTTLKVMRQAMGDSSIGPDKILGIGIANQRETTVLWERETLRPVHNAIVWQCRRSARICERLKEQGLGPLFQARTGLVLDPYFSGTKVTWLLDEVPGLKARAMTGDIAFGTIDTWLIAKLTAGRIHATDFTNASRTLMFNIHERKWDRELLGILDIPFQVLPDVVPSAGVLGMADASIIGKAIPIAGITGDQQAALFGQACFSGGEAKSTFGTGCFLLRNSGDERIEPGKGLILTLACREDGKPCYALEGSVFIAGAALQWLRDGLGLIRNVAETRAIAESVKDTQGVYMVPAFAGLGAPYWDMYARGGILGITRSTTRAHIVRAALEGIAFQVKDLVMAFEDVAKRRFEELRVDGGASSNDFLMQRQADILGCPVDRARYIESTGIGAAFLAGIGTGFWAPGDPVRELRKSGRVFHPRISGEERKEAYEGWRDAVRRVRSTQPS